MTCDLCQNEAKVYLTKLVGGKQQKVNLCDSCASENEVNDPTGYELTKMLKGMGEETVTSSQPGERHCHSCGFTQSDFKKTGRFGCASCYQVFSEGLENLLEAMHRHTRHAGKQPEHFSELRREIDDAAGIASAGYESELSDPGAQVAPEEDDDEFIDEATLAAIAELDFSLDEEEDESEDSDEGDEVAAVEENPFEGLPDLETIFDSPPQPEKELTDEEKLEELKLALEVAIQKEDYEACADLRDQINALEAS